MHVHYLQLNVDEDQALPSRALRRVFAFNKENWPFLAFGLLGGLAVGTTWPIYSMLISYVTKVIYHCVHSSINLKCCNSQNYDR